MEAEQWWYYLSGSRQVGPYSRNELHLLLSKEVISPTTLVWTQDSGGWRALRDVSDEPVIESHKRPRHWIVAALVVTIFFGGITIVVTVPKGGESRNAVAIMTKEKNTQGLLERIHERSQVQITEIATLNFSRSNERVEDRSNSSPISAHFMFNPVGSLSAQAAPVTIAALSPEGHLVQEFWRSIANSPVVDRYEFYLRRYPSGSFADIAAARIKELRKTSKQEMAGTARKKANTSSSKTRKPKKSAKTTAVKISSRKMDGRCWSRNIEQCRKRCREGEARACQKLKRLGG